MTDHHHHDHSGPIAIGATTARVVVGLLTGIGVLVVIGTVLLWPSHQHVDIPLPMQNGGGGAVTTEAGTVTMQDIGPCGSPSNGKVFEDTPQPPPNDTYSCARSLVSIESGPHKGHHTLLEIAPGPGQPVLHTGDHIRIARQNDPSGQPAYSFEDFSRGFPLTLIVLIFIAVIVVVARWRGLRAVLGLGFAFLVLVMFMLPALLDGKPALPVAVVAGALILYAVLYLAHGVNLRTSSALLGTLSAMLLATVLSWAALKITHVTGLSQEDNSNVATYVQHVSITGLLFAGFIIGSLGVLNDVTITQASAAFELAAIDEKASRREVFVAAMRVGRDHIASTVYTLVLAYAGGALPLLLMFSVAGRSLGDVITGDAVAIEIARSAVGGICLALSVPLTTLIAVLLARPFSLKPEPVPARRVARKAKAGTGERHSQHGQRPVARRRVPDKQRNPEPEPRDEDDEDYLHSLSQEEYRPRRPGRDNPRRRAAANQQPAEPYPAPQPAPGQIGPEPYPSPEPPMSRGAATPYPDRLPGQVQPGYRPADPAPASRHWANPSPAHDADDGYAQDWFTSAAPNRLSDDPYSGKDHAGRRPGGSSSGRHAGGDHPDQQSDPAYPGAAEPTQRQTGYPRLSPAPDDPTSTAGRRYRRDWPPADYDE